MFTINTLNSMMNDGPKGARLVSVHVHQRHARELQKSMEDSQLPPLLKERIWKNECCNIEINFDPEKAEPHKALARYSDGSQRTFKVGDSEHTSATQPADSNNLLDKWFDQQPHVRRKELVKMALRRVGQRVREIAAAKDEKVAADMGEALFYEILQEEKQKEAP